MLASVEEFDDITLKIRPFWSRIFFLWKFVPNNYSLNGIIECQNCFGRTCRVPTFTLFTLLYFQTLFCTLVFAFAVAFA